MKRAILAIVSSIAFASLLMSWSVMYKEEFYRFYHIHYTQDPTDTVENIYWLERAQKAPFCNPLYALVKIEDKKQWEKYRYLLDMHILLKLIEQHLVLGASYDKRIAYFYNAPWKRENLESLAIAETCYKTALAYWAEAKELAAKARAMRWIFMEGADAWLTESARIESGDLNYARVIERQLERLERVRADFEAMDASTY